MFFCHNREVSKRVCSIYSYYSLFSLQRLLCPPAVSFMMVPEDPQLVAKTNPLKLLIRGDSHGRISIWDLTNASQVQKGSVIKPTSTMSLEEAWKQMNPQPCGILDQLVGSRYIAYKHEFQFLLFLIMNVSGG